ncbi:MAG: phosphodiesterase [Acidiferrobacterales bacterium]
MIIAQISDFHVDLRVDTRVGVIDTHEQLQRAVAHVNRLRPTPEVVLITGDLTNDGTPAQYRLVKEALSELFIPYYVIPGNHDDRQGLYDAFAEYGYLPPDAEFLQYVIDDHAVRLLALDTLIPGEEGGELCQTRLAWLHDRLAEAPRAPTLIFMHHPPVATGLAVFDAMALRGADGLAAIIARHAQIEAIICGHVHRPLHLRWQGTVVSTAPSVSFQYPLDMQGLEDIQPVDEPPACRVYVWDHDVGLVAHTSYIGHGGLR